jgi:CubicO group peptidase (beta-lactamase class C family)
MGYESANAINIPQSWEWYHTTPASSVNSTAKDMAQWIIAHLEQGKLHNNTIMPAEMMLRMLSHQAGMHPDMYGMAYGFFEEYYGNLRFLYHGGNMAGFNSLVVLIPGKKAGFFFVSHHEGSSLRDNLQWAIMDRYYKNEVNNKAPVISNDSTRASLFAGRYKYNVYCHTCPNPPATMTFTIKANADGSIHLNNRKWIETASKLLFRRADGKSTIAFRADSSGKITHLSLGGYWTFEKI